MPFELCAVEYVALFQKIKVVESTTFNGHSRLWCSINANQIAVTFDFFLSAL